ncbi:MAG: T9SS type A sorting domain-containing protein [Bacteroidetes bacterium]|nr:T9SS type A sorting domain-containing protein [Bacteroidota bacterium]
MKKTFSLLLLFFLSVNLTFSQKKEVIKPALVAKPVYFDISPPMKDLANLQVTHGDNSWKDGIIKNHFNIPGSQDKSALPFNYVDPAIQHFFGPTVTGDTTIQNFDGNNNNQGYDPPDTHGDVGPNNYVQVVNCHYSVYSKTGASLLGPLNTSALWQGMSNNSNDGDAVVLYDENADRWLISQFSLPHYPNGPFFQMIAISQTPDPTGTYYRYQYQYADMGDYPKLGVWGDGYYMGVNRFSSGAGSFMGTGAAAFNRTKMLAGDQTAEMVWFTLPSSNPARAPQPADCDGDFAPAGTPEYFAYIKDGSSSDYLGILELQVDWTTPANSTLGNLLQVPVESFNSNISGIPQKGTSRKADVLSDRLMYRLQFRKFSDHWSLLTNHTVNAGSGVGGVRWYEFRKTTGDWSVYQQSTYSPDANSRWMGSIAMDSSGNIALGFSISSANMYPSIYYTGRMSSDALNTMTIGEKAIFYGTGSNTANDGTTSGNCRWGDYSAISVDPSAGSTFWYTQEYCQTNGSNWRTRIGSFSWASILSLSATATPSTLCTGDSSHLNAIATGGSGTYTYSWTSIPAGFVSTIQNPVVTPTITTNYVASINDGSATKTDTIAVTVNQHPTAFAGNDTVVCITVPVLLLHGQATGYSHVQWVTTGDGAFISDTIPVTIYTPGPNDKIALTWICTLTASALSPCSTDASDQVQLFLSPCNGITENQANGFSMVLSPNPSKGVFDLNIKGLQNQPAALTITNTSGQMVYNDNLSGMDNSSKRIDLSASPKGVYLVKIQTGNQVRMEKLVLQ